jgi:uncharacterized membrane protein
MAAMKAKATGGLGQHAERDATELAAGRFARGLGWLSLGLGAASIVAPRAISRFGGMDDSATATGLIRMSGLREVGQGAALLRGRQPAGWTWSRVVMDVFDLALLRMAMQNRSGDRRRRAATFTAAIAGITAMDLIAAIRTSRMTQTRGRALYVQASVTVNRPSDEVYRFWHDFENLPRFMNHLEAVRMTGDGRSRWTAQAPAGRTVEWDAEIIEDRPNQLIAWRSMPGAKVPNAGRVSFMRAAGGRGTEVRVELEYRPPAGALGKAVAKLFGEEPEQQVRDDLRRFKQVIETGEVVRSDGSPQGTSARQQMQQRPARPMAFGRIR